MIPITQQYIHHLEQNHDSEIIEGSQVAHISQELCSSLKRIPSIDPHNQPITLHNKKMQKPKNQKQPTLDQSELANQPNHHQEIEQERPKIKNKALY